MYVCVSAVAGISAGELVEGLVVADSKALVKTSGSRLLQTVPIAQLSIPYAIVFMRRTRAAEATTFALLESRSN